MRKYVVQGLRIMKKEEVIVFIDEETITPEELLEGDTYESGNEGV